MDNNRFKNQQPLCKFGPGGQFISEVQPAQTKPESIAVQNPMLKVLDILADLIGGAVQPELLTETLTVSNLQPHPIAKENSCEQHRTTTQSCDYAKAAGSIASHKHLHEQALLFTDVRRAVRRTEHHTSNRIRAYSKPSRKKAHQAVAWQGPLFAAHGCGKKTA
jgi:hypothetical protein